LRENLASTCDFDVNGGARKEIAEEKIERGGGEEANFGPVNQGIRCLVPSDSTKGSYRMRSTTKKKKKKKKREDREKREKLEKKRRKGGEFTILSTIKRSV